MSFNLSNLTTHGEGRPFFRRGHGGSRRCATGSLSFILPDGWEEDEWKGGGSGRRGGGGGGGGNAERFVY